MSGTQRYPNKRMSSILPGRPLKIREGLYKQLREREWIFKDGEQFDLFDSQEWSLRRGRSNRRHRLESINAGTLFVNPLEIPVVATRN